MSENAEDLFNEYDKVYIHIATLEELDSMNHDYDSADDYRRNKAYKARRAMRLIDEYSQLEIIPYEPKSPLPQCLIADKRDNRILCTAKDLYDESKVTFITEDLNLLIKAESIGIKNRFRWKWDSQDKNKEVYTGIRETWLSESEYVSLMEGLDGNVYNLYPNEYLILNNTTSNDQYLLMWNGKFFEEVKARPMSNKYLNKINPLDIHQKAFIHMLQNDRAKVKITDSPYGCGKTFLMLHWALSVLEKKYNKLYFVKSDSPPKSRKEYPALPGGINEKSEGLMGVLCDITDESNLGNILLRNDKLEIMPIQFAKGRSLNNAILMVNEAQDFTPSEMERLVSRIGENTVVLLDGSTKQIDNRNCFRKNGLTTAINNFKDKEIAAQVNLITDFRSEISRMVGEMDWSD
jgi:PhoH-like ATPase